MQITFLVGNQTEYIILKKTVYSSKLKPLYTAFLHGIKRFEYRIEVKFNKDPLAVEQNKYLNKIVTVYIFYELDAWPRTPTKKFIFKSILFGVTSIIKNSDKEKYVYSIVTTE